MLVELDRNDLIKLIKGSEPTYEQMDDPLIKSCGYFAASYGVWHWNYGAFEYLKEDALLSLFLFLKGGK